MRHGNLKRGGGLGAARLCEQPARTVRGPTHEKTPASLPGKDGGGLVAMVASARRARHMRRLTFSGDSLRSSRAANTDMV